jgi:hypothetical protein
VSANVKVDGLAQLSQRVARWPAEVDAAIAKAIVDEIRPMISHMTSRASAVSRVAGMAASTARIVSTPKGLAIMVGGTGGLASTVLKGAEFGGRRRKKKAVVMRSPRGRGYIARRRTTMQFAPFLGNRGYWFWPTARTDLRGVNARVGKVLSSVVSK